MTSTVSIVDDDAAVRDSWSQLLAMHGYQVREYADAAVYLKEDSSSPDSCLLLDIRMPGMNGMELQNELQRRGRADPIVFVTGYVFAKLSRLNKYVAATAPMLLKSALRLPA